MTADDLPHGVPCLHDVDAILLRLLRDMLEERELIVDRRALRELDERIIEIMARFVPPSADSR